MFNSNLLWLCLLASPLAFANPVPQAVPSPPPQQGSTQAAAPEQQLGYWQTAGSNTISPTTRLSFTIDVMKWREEMNSQLVAPTIQPEKLGFAIRGAYNFSGKWQGYLRVQRHQSQAIRKAALNQAQTETGVAYSSGVRFTLRSGLFLEGALSYDDEQAEDASQFIPQVSFGYKF